MSELSELFERDPLHYSNLDIDTIIQKMRQLRSQYELGAKIAPVGERKKKVNPQVEDLLKDLGD